MTDPLQRITRKFRIVQALEPFVPYAKLYPTDKTVLHVSRGLSPYIMAINQDALKTFAPINVHKYTKVGTSNDSI